MTILKHSLRLPLISFTIITIGLMSGCKSGGGPQKGLSTKNSVVWYLSSDVESINPMLSSDEGSNYVEGLIYEHLSGNDPRDLSIIPQLASLPQESPDHLTWTFTMDPAARWSDGKPVTAEDVVYSYKIVNNPYVLNAAPTRGYFTLMDSAWIPADHPNQVIFHWRSYRFDLLKIMNYVSVVPKHIWDPTNLSDKVSWADLRKEQPSNPAAKQVADEFQDPKFQRDLAHTVGSGQYKFETWITNDRITVHRDTNYWGKDRAWGDAYPDQITFKTIKDPNAALIALKNQDIDIDQALTSPQYLVDLADTAKFSYIKKDTLYFNTTSSLQWNNARPLFSDVRVRKALTMLVDRDEIIRVILKGLSKKVEQPVAPTQPNFDPTVKEAQYDPEGAKKLLAEAGWADHDGDGVLDKVINGKKVDFKFMFTAPSGSDIPKQVLLIVSNNLKKAGIVADISQIEWSVYLENQRTHNFDASLGAWVGNMDEDEISQLWETSQSKNGSNNISYSDPEADKLMEAIKIEPDKAKRYEMSHRLKHILADDQPVTWLYSSPARIAWVDRFDNFQFFPTRPPFAPQYWIVRGAGITRRPTGIPMSLSAARSTQIQ